MVQGVVSRRRPLKPVIKLTADCNLRCRYCYQAERFVYGERMDFQTLERILRELDAVACRPVSLLWYGGEPMLYGLSDFTGAVERANAVLGEVRHSIQTNGVLIDRAWSQLFARHNFGVTVSLDGPAVLHDAQRINRAGRPTQAMVLRGIRCLQEAGLSPRVACVVTAASVPHAEELVEYLASLAISEVDFPPAMRFGPRADLEPFVTPEQYAHFLSRALRGWMRLGRPDFRIRSLVGLARKIKGAPGNYCKLEGDCSSYLTFTTQGEVYPCDEFSGLPDSALGNLRTQSLGDILNSDKARGTFREWTSSPQECRSCQWQEHCPGSCPFERRASGSLAQRSLLCLAWKRILAELSSLM